MVSNHKEVEDVSTMGMNLQEVVTVDTTETNTQDMIKGKANLIEIHLLIMNHLEEMTIS
jgi:hypothetical protein